MSNAFIDGALRISAVAQDASTQSQLTLATRCPTGTLFSRASTPDEPAGTMIIAADSNFGQILYDASGQAIYLFDAEDSDRPRLPP
jgi:hypothetical protein